MHQFILDDGKYTLLYNDDTYVITATRYGSPWRDFTGDKLMHLVVLELIAKRALEQAIHQGHRLGPGTPVNPGKP